MSPIKSACYILIFLILLFACSACNFYNQAVESNKITKSDSYTSDIPEAELKENLDSYESKLKALKADKILKIVLMNINGTVYTTINKGLISKWVNLLKKMKLSSKPFEGVTIPGFSLTVYWNDGSKLLLGGYELPYIYNNPYPIRTMLYLDNYNQLKNEFDQLTDPSQPYSTSLYTQPRTTTITSASIGSSK